jgi:hypothetical protein
MAYSQAKNSYRMAETKWEKVRADGEFLMVYSTSTKKGRE